MCFPDTFYMLQACQAPRAQGNKRAQNSAAAFGLCFGTAMSLRCGIVGLPNVGKSTLFNAITRAKAQAANYPFCTIEPNLGQVAVPDKRLDTINKIVKPKRNIPAMTEFVDIAGLVEGASKGEGLGNQFLSHIRQTQAIAHVVRCFEDDNISHVRDGINPEDGINIIHTELALADLESLTKQCLKLSKKARSADKHSKVLLAVGEKLLEHIEKGEPARTLELGKEEAKLAASFQLITNKPLFYVCNIDEASVQEANTYTKQALSLAQKEGAAVVQICAKVEEELAALSKEEQEEYLASIGLVETGLNLMIRTAYGLLNLITFFTAGEEEVRAWTTPKGSLAPEAAGAIHSDMERGFIRAELTAYKDFLEAGSLQRAREKGKMRLEGKEYVIQDGDIVYFRFKAPVVAAAKKA